MTKKGKASCKNTRTAMHAYKGHDETQTGKKRVHTYALKEEPNKKRNAVNSSDIVMMPDELSYADNR